MTQRKITAPLFRLAPLMGQQLSLAHKEIHRILKKSLAEFVSERLADSVNKELLTVFKQIADMGHSIVLDDSMLIEGIEVKVSKTNKGELDISCLTNFYPYPRHPIHKGDVTPLGVFKAFDLYIARQSTLPPTYVARYGGGASDYYSLNPDTVQKGLPDGQPSEVFDAFNRRVNLLESFLKTP